ncbi:subtilase-type protease inhibitor [Streptomyces sp. NPDC085932]|uniref:subtilase-type protease inhibitor n=1 Tax=Streptomyces sp. NPDC085932 TaxID=3365741 RepID=UPI0037CF7594
MRKSTGLAATVLATAAITGAAPSAHAEPGSLYAPSALVITSTRADGFGTIDQATTLSCAPRPTGTHPAPGPACQELRRTAGDFGTLLAEAGDHACIKIYAPVTIGIEGVWQGQRVSWQRSFANACEREAAVQGNAVFAF